MLLSIGVGGAAPPIRRIRREPRVEPQHRLDFTTEHAALPYVSKGGELVLKLFAFIRRDEGQTMAEYGVVLAVMTLAVLTAFTLLSENVREALESVANIL